MLFINATGITKIEDEKLTQWLGGEADAVPPAVLDCVVTVPVGQSGP